jgi:6-phosphogluconolactonase
MSDMQREVIALYPAAYAQRAAALLHREIVEAIGRRGDCRLVLAGGRTPAAVYRALAARGDVDWSRVQLYFGDERCGGTTHTERNFWMVMESLIKPAAVPGANVHRMRGEAPPAEALQEYETTLQRLSEPKFDLVLLGMGADGHTASLFPDDARALSAVSWTTSAIAPPTFAVEQRLTLTMRALCSTHTVCVMCAGDEKAPVRDAILAGDASAQRLPAARVHGLDRTLWLIEAE